MDKNSKLDYVKNYVVSIESEENMRDVPTYKNRLWPLATGKTMLYSIFEEDQEKDYSLIR